MDSPKFQNRACELAEGLLDSYASDELRSHLRQETRTHLAACARCSALLEERRRVREMLRRAVRRDEAPRRLVSAIRAMISQA
ncbi:MAG: hypothetical protein H7Z38_13235 [Rubrivivax sp.]|nr:hypothetical protein [Pyrinomonadaceae bacterium]